MCCWTRKKKDGYKKVEEGRDSSQAPAIVAGGLAVDSTAGGSYVNVGDGGGGGGGGGDLGTCAVM